MSGESYFLALVVSDEGETEPFLRSQLHLTKELLLLECGPYLLANANSMSLPSRRISSVIGTMTHLCSLKQSFLVQSIEELLAHSVSTNVKDSIINILNEKIEAHSNIEHAFLCVGTKLVAVYKKPKSLNLSSQDVFLLIILFNSHFEPHHLPKQAIKGYEDPFFIPSQYLLEIDSRVIGIGNRYHIVEFYDSLDIAGVEGIHHLNYDINLAGPIIKSIKLVLKHVNLYFGQLDYEFDSELIENLIQIQLKYKIEPASGQINLKTLKAIVINFINNLNLNQPKEASDYEEAKIALRYLVDDRLKITAEEMNLQNVYQICYLSSNNYKPRTVYFTHFDDRITLTLISNSQQKSEKENQTMKLIGNQIKENIYNYQGYLLSMESSYSMISYINQFPGLSHFIFINRSKNRLIAPEITDLSGNITIVELKKHVWNMCYQATEFLYHGSFEMLQLNGNFQYSYRLLFFDQTGLAVVPKEKLVIPNKMPINRFFYKWLVQTLFPGLKVHFYELICLYIGSIPLKLVQNYNDILISILARKV